MDSTSFDESTFIKCGEVFRSGNGKYQYQCVLCEIILERATELEQHTSIHINLLLETTGDETTTLAEEHAEDEPVLYFQYAPESDEIIPIGMEMVIVDELSSSGTNNLISVELPKLDETLEITSQIKTKDLQTHTHYLEEFSSYEKATEQETNFDQGESVQNVVVNQDSDADIAIANLYGFEPELVLTCSICSTTFHSNDELGAHMLIHNKTTASTNVGHQNEAVDSTEGPYKCTLCLKVFSSSNRLSIHLKCHGKKFKCSECPKSFTRNANLKQHIKQYHPNVENVKKKGPFTCSICGKVFRFQNAITAHLNRHNGIRPYKCEQCSKTFASQHHLKNHVFIHSDLRQFKCDTCSKAFKTKSTLRTHTEMHLRFAGVLSKPQRPRKKYKIPSRSCNICGKIMSASSVKAHMRTHTGERPYKCKLCPNAYRQSFRLTDHMRIHAGIRSIQCPLCPKIFITDYQLRSHNRMHLRQSNGTGPQKRLKKPQCHICGLKVAQMSKHLKKKHSPAERPHKCDVCEKSYTCSTYLKAHKRAVHSDERPFACHLCPKTFKTKSNRAAHFRFHNGTVKTFQCDLCEYVCHNKERANIHVRVRHTGEKPFGCDHCDATFASKKTMEQHQKLHLSEKQFQCRYCDKTFAQNAGRRSHERRVHEDTVKKEEQLFI